MKKISANIEATHTNNASNFIFFSKQVFLSSKIVDPIVKKATLKVMKKIQEKGSCNIFGIGKTPIDINDNDIIHP